MSEVHCKNNRDNNYQTKKLIDDMWWKFQERMDKGTDVEAGLHFLGLHFPWAPLSGVSTFQGSSFLGLTFSRDQLKLEHLLWDVSWGLVALVTKPILQVES